MKRQLLGAFVLIGLQGIVSSARPQESAEPVSVDGICGKLVSVEEVPEKGTPNSARQGVKPLEHARIRLFSPVAGADCCALITPVAEATTGRDGIFQFRRSNPADYWLVVTIGGKDFKVLIRYEPGKKGALDCSKFSYTLEKGKLELRRTGAATVSQK